MTAHDYARPVRLPRRSRQGVVMGMDGWQLTCITIAAIVVLGSVNRFGPPGLLYAAPIYLPIGAFAFVTIHGDSAPRQAGLWLMKQTRHMAGATRHVYRPERAQLAGTLNLPGIRASVQLWNVDGVACAYNPHDRSVSVTAEVEVQGFLMKDLAERYDLAQQWSPVLASFTQRPGIKRAVLQERTNPTTIRAARDHYESSRRRRGLDGTSPIARNYDDVMNTSETFAVSHRNYVTFTLDLIALGPQLKALGGGEDAVKRAKRGVDGSAADAADWQALERQEEEIVAGHGEFRYGAYLTVTARDEQKLEQAVAGMRNALARAGMEPQVLYCQQAEALMVNALPLGLGMK